MERSAMKSILALLGFLLAALPAAAQTRTQCTTDNPTNCYTPLTNDTSIPTNATGGFTGSLSVGVSSAQLVAANAARQYRLAIKNESAAASVSVCLGTCTAALNTSGSMTISPGQMLTLSDAAYVPGDAVNAIASAASTPVTVWSR